MKRKWDIIDESLHQKCINAVITRIGEIEGEAGIITAQDLIDIVAQYLGPAAYNKGVRDTKKILDDKLLDLDAETDLLLQ